MTAIPDHKQDDQPQGDQIAQHPHALVTAAYLHGRLDRGRDGRRLGRRNVFEQRDDPLAVGLDQPGIAGQITPDINRRGNARIVVFFQRRNDPGVQMQAFGDLRDRQRPLFAPAAQQAAGRGGLALGARVWRPIRHLSDPRTAQQAGLG